MENAKRKCGKVGDGEGEEWLNSRDGKWCKKMELKGYIIHQCENSMLSALQYGCFCMQSPTTAWRQAGDNPKKLL